MTIVREEIKNIEAYLEIQLFMHDHSFDITKEISDDILDVSMPNLILQPIVENAIHHGIDLLEDRKGMLTIRGFSADGYIVLQVEDNGVGIDGETCEKLLTIQSSGYGVRNVNERIMLLYGECYHIEVTSELDVGTIVTVRIPYSMGENE